MQRASGILMSITSLPSPYGIGTIGKEARDFADFLETAGQKIWQLLPVCPTSYGDSPYQSFSTYAGNPYLIDLDYLAEEGLLDKDTLEKISWGDDPEKVDYETIYNNRFNVLRTAYNNFKQHDQKEFRRFKIRNAAWLKDYALYMAVKQSFGMCSWTEWPDESIRNREQNAVEKYTRKYRDEINFWKFLQFKFYQQWNSFREYVNSKNVILMGDMPIYVALDSADVWANPEIFWLNEEKQPVCVAGCPPDYFSETGQLWGNPLYNWEYLKETNYTWWFNRIKAASKLFDLTRIDHFRAFDAYYAIPFPAEDAKNGSWYEGPGIEFFLEMKKAIGDIPIVAEDLGTHTESLEQLLEDSGYPGMKVLQFAFDSGEANNHLPHHYIENSIVYTGTHDNDTLLGWQNKANAYDINSAVDYCGITDDEGFCSGIIRTAYESKSNYVIIQMQDWLELGTEARMNIPSTLGENWVWRIDKRALTTKLANKIKTMCKITGRMGDT